MSSTDTPLLYSERRICPGLKAVLGISENNVKLFWNIMRTASIMDSSFVKALITFKKNSGF
jgi:hypothetical protein